MMFNARRNYHFAYLENRSRVILMTVIIGLCFASYAIITISFNTEDSTNFWNSVFGQWMQYFFCLFPGLVIMVCNTPRDIMGDFNKYPEMIKRVSVLQYTTLHMIYDCRNYRDLAFNLQQTWIDSIYYQGRDVSPS